MTTDTTYNGHKDRGHWNVALWIGNDEPMYRYACGMIEQHGQRKAARVMARELRGERTPDRFAYTFSRIYAALDGLVEDARP